MSNPSYTQHFSETQTEKKITQNHLVPKMMPTGSKIALPHVINLEKMYNNNMKNMTLKNVYS